MINTGMYTFNLLISEANYDLINLNRMPDGVLNNKTKNWTPATETGLVQDDGFAITLDDGSILSQ